MNVKKIFLLLSAFWTTCILQPSPCIAYTTEVNPSKVEKYTTQAHTNNWNSFISDKATELDDLKSLYAEKICKDFDKNAMAAYANALMTEFAEWLLMNAHYQPLLMSQYRTYLAPIEYKQLNFCENIPDNKKELTFEFGWDTIQKTVFSTTLDKNSDIFTYAIMFAPKNANLEGFELVPQGYFKWDEYFWSGDCADEDIHRDVEGDNDLNTGIATLFDPDDDEYFIDMPPGDKQQKVFPGILIRDRSGGTEDEIVCYTNLDKAKTIAKKIAFKLSNTNCKDLKIYIVQIAPKKVREDYRAFWGWGRTLFVVDDFGRLDDVIVVEKIK